MIIIIIITTTHRSLTQYMHIGRISDIEFLF